MSFTIVSLVFAFILRLPALYAALTQVGGFKLSFGNLVAIALFSTLLGVIMPAGPFDVIGAIFRIVLLSIILMVLMRAEINDALKAVVVAAVIETVIIFTISLSPVAFLVAGLSPFSVP